VGDIFVSYAHEDRARIAPLVARLEDEGWSVWWDREMVAGDRFEQAIDAAICEANCVIVAWSRAGLASDWVRNEALEGLERHILVPVMLDEVRVPVAFRQHQAARLHHWPGAFDPEEMGLLLRGVKDVLGAARAATPVLTRDAALDRLQQLVAQRDADAAVAFASELAAAGLRGDQDVDALLAEVATQYQILSEPPGARVRVKAYEAPHSPWRDIGVTPVDALIANGLRRLRLELDGYDPVEIAEAIPGFVGVSPEFGATYPKLVRLQRPDPGRPSMVFVPGISGLQYGPRMSDYFVDRFEVTNEDFKAFVDAGGYRNEAYWSHLSFVDGDASLTFGDALKRFVDTTGRSGPAQWRFGDFPDGESRLPVTGISWFEASAYARFRGGELPTAGHWDLAAIECLDMVAPFAPAVIAQSNFGAALAPVGASTAISAFGAYDMAGNAREWVRNAIGNRRTTLGGSHRDPQYMFVHKVALDPWQRDDVTGFRTIRSLGDDDPSVDLPLRTYEPPRDLTPVSDDEFKILATQFAYTRSEPRVMRRELLGARALAL
jgi:eukaryotic-like serine/threonine-protein kinase